MTTTSTEIPVVRGPPLLDHAVRLRSGARQRSA